MNIAVKILKKPMGFINMKKLSYKHAVSIKNVMEVIPDWKGYESAEVYFFKDKSGVIICNAHEMIKQY